MNIADGDLELIWNADASRVEAVKVRENGVWWTYGPNGVRTVSLDGPRDGETFSPADDTDRLNAQMKRVYDALADGQWHGREEIERLTGDNWASASARARDLRKPRFGGHNVERRAMGHGLWEYRLVLSQAVADSPSPG